VGDSVLLRTPGLDAKLIDAWEGFYTVTWKLGLVTYELDVGKKKKRVAHINTLRKYEERGQLKRITTVLEDDTVDDSLVDSNAKLKLVEGSLEEGRLADVMTWQKEFSDTLSEKPGETDLVQFSINTGDAEPIAQRPYMIAVGLRVGVEEELEWLLKMGYIRESRSL